MQNLMKMYIFRVDGGIYFLIIIVIYIMLGVQTIAEHRVEEKSMRQTFSWTGYNIVS